MRQSIQFHSVNLSFPLRLIILLSSGLPPFNHYVVSSTVYTESSYTVVLYRLKLAAWCLVKLLTETHI